MATRDTAYANTDFVLRSDSTLDSLIAELRLTCWVPYYTHEDDGRCDATINANHDHTTGERNAAMDIASMLAALGNLSAAAKAEFHNCDRRDFNIGFECWDSWGFNHALPNEVLRAIAKAGCTLSITLYPMRNADGTPKV